MNAAVEFWDQTQNLVGDAVLFAATHVTELARLNARLFLFGVDKPMGGAVGY